MMVAPDVIREQILDAMTELRKAPNAHYAAELKKEEAQLAYQKAYDLAFLQAVGNVEERKSVARQAASDAQLVLAVAEAEFNRIKLKTRQLEQSVMASQSLLRSIQQEGA